MDAIYICFKSKKKNASKDLQLWHDLIHREEEAQLCRLEKHAASTRWRLFAMGMIFGVS